VPVPRQTKTAAFEFCDATALRIEIRQRALIYSQKKRVDNDPQEEEQ